MLSLMAQEHLLYKHQQRRPQLLQVDRYQALEFSSQIDAQQRWWQAAGDPGQPIRGHTRSRVAVGRGLGLALGKGLAAISCSTVPSRPQPLLATPFVEAQRYVVCVPSRLV